MRSSILAVLLREQGYEVRGAYVDFSGLPLALWKSVYPGVADPSAPQKVIDRARAVGLELDIIPGAGLFEQQIVDRLLHSCLNQQQGAPGVLFHSKVLLPSLCQWAKAKGYDQVATGHRCAVNDDDIYLSGEADDHALKLGFLDHATMGRVIFPLGNFQLTHLQKLGSQLKGAIPTEPDERRPILHPYLLNREGWCAWVKDKVQEPFTHRGWVRRQDASSGLAEHQGMYRHPVGLPMVQQTEQPGDQKSEVEALFVTGCDHASSTLWVAPITGTIPTYVELSDLLWREGPWMPPMDGLEVEVHLAEPEVAPSATLHATAKLVFHSNATGRLLFKGALPGVFLGTPLIFSKQSRVLGSAWVSKWNA